MNEIHLQGQVKRVWTYDDNLYVRLSVRRSPGRPKRTPREGGPYDYVTIVFPDGKSQLSFEPGQYLTVHGWLQSRDFDESLRDFLKRAEMKDVKEAVDIPAGQQRNTVLHRSVIEVVAERWVIDRGGNGK
jgi:hypothetical protein